MIYTICAEHNTTTLVGPGTLISELECPTCIGISDGLIAVPTPTDPEELFISQITRHDGGNCCCERCEPSFCFNCGHYQQFCTCLDVVIYSPNFCDHRADVPSYACRNKSAGVDCQHPECNATIPF